MFTTGFTQATGMQPLRNIMPLLIQQVNMFDAEAEFAVCPLVCVLR